MVVGTIPNANAAVDDVEATAAWQEVPAKALEKVLFLRGVHFANFKSRSTFQYDLRVLMACPLPESLCELSRGQICSNLTEVHQNYCTPEAVSTVHCEPQ